MKRFLSCFPVIKILPVLFLLLSCITLSAQKIKGLIEKGDLAGLQKMEAKGLDIFYPMEIPYYHESDGEEGWEIMHPMSYAIIKDQPEIVDYYISKKESELSLDQWHEALAQSFIISLSKRDSVTAEKLYALGPDLDYLCTSCRDHNAVMVAVAYGLEDWYFRLKPSSNLAAESSVGNTLLHIAASGESHAIFEDVLTSGNYNVNETNIYAETPLDFAAQGGNVDYFYHLLEAGADVNSAGMIWFSVAVSGNMEIYEYIEKNVLPDGIYYTDQWLDNALSVALQQNHTDMVVALVNRSIKYRDEYNSSMMSYDFIDNYMFVECDVNPLYWAIWNENKTAYEAYLHLAGDVNSVMESDYMPIDKGLTKQASKVFGKEYVTEMYGKYNIITVD